MSGCSSSKNEVTTSTEEAVITEIENNNETYQTDTSIIDTQNIEIKHDEQLTVEGTIILNESSFPEYCLKLDKNTAITLYDGDFSENFECNTLYFYDEADINGNYNYNQLENKKCIVTACLENYRGGGELFLLNPTIMIEGKEAEQIVEAAPEIIGNFIGKWNDMGIGSSAPADAVLWDVEYRSDGTGSFYFIYDVNDIVSLDFNYSTYDTYLGESVDGIAIEFEEGVQINYMTKYTWSNELQKMLMTVYEVKDNGILNTDVYWVYSHS